MKSPTYVTITILWIVKTTALPPCSFKRGTGVVMTCDVSQSNVTSLQWQVGGMMSEVYPYLTTCDLHGCDKQSYGGTHNFTATVQLDPSSTRIVNSRLQLSGDHFFSFFVGDYECVPDGSQPIKICDDLNYFDDPTPPICGSPIVDDVEVQIICTIDNVYPDPQCRINIATNGQSRDISTATIAESSEMVVHPDYMSFSAICNVSIPLTDLGVGYHVFQLVASANFNDTDLAEVHSNNASLIISSVPQKPKCMYPGIYRTSKAIVVECYTSFIYPALGCEMAVFKNNVPIVLPFNVTYSNGIALYQAKNISVSKCYSSISLVHLGPGSFEFLVTMFTMDNNGTVVNGTRIEGDMTSPLVLKNPTLSKDLNQDCPANISSILEDGQASCFCELDEIGNPRGFVRWRSSDGKIIPFRTVVADFYDFKANRTFTCTPFTPIADDLPGFTWAPFWPDPPTLESFTANGERSPFVTDVNTSVILHCQPGGTPLPTVTITQQGTDTPILTNGTSVLINITGCADTTSYMCRALDTSGTTVDSGAMNIFVRCPLQLVDKNVSPIIVKSESKKSVDLYLRLSGYPNPTTFLLVKNTVKGLDALMHWRDFDYDYNVTDQQIINMRLTVKYVVDSANYTLTVGNGFGQLLSVDFSVMIQSIAETSDVNIGAIVGGVIGGIVAIVAVMVFSCCLLRKKKSSSNQADAIETIRISRVGS